MINIDNILNLAIKSIKSTISSAIYVGKIVSTNKVFDTSTNTTTTSPTYEDVEIIPESISYEEIQSSKLLETDIKLYVICNVAYNLKFYNAIEFNGDTFKIKQIVDSTIGSKIALHTIIATKQS